MAYTKITKPTTTYIKDGLPLDREILQDRSILLFQDDIEVILNLIVRDYDLALRPSTVYTTITKPTT